MALRGVLQMPLHDRIADEMAAALARHQIALADQLLVSEHRVARDAQVVGQVAAGGHRRAGRQVAAEDGRDQHLAHAALQAEIGALSRSNRRSHNTGLSIAAWLDMAAPSEGGGRAASGGRPVPARRDGRPVPFFSIEERGRQGMGIALPAALSRVQAQPEAQCRMHSGCSGGPNDGPNGGPNGGPNVRSGPSRGSPAVPGSAPADRRRRRRRRSR